MTVQPACTLNHTMLPIAVSRAQFCCTLQHQELHTAHNIWTLMTTQPACTLTHIRLHAAGRREPSKLYPVCVSCTAANTCCAYQIEKVAQSPLLRKITRLVCEYCNGRRCSATTGKDDLLGCSRELQRAMYSQKKPLEPSEPSCF